MFNLFFIRVVGAFALIFIFTFYKNNQEIINSLNLMLFFIAIYDFGLQQSGLMKLFQKKIHFVVDVICILIVSAILLNYGFIKLLDFQLITLVSILNIHQSISNNNSRNSQFLIISLLRPLMIFITIELEYFYNAAIIFLLALIFFRNLQSSNKKIYFKKRLQFGLLVIAGTASEQLIRIGGDLSYEVSLLILVSGYCISLASSFQQSILHFFFHSSTQSSEKEEVIKYANHNTSLIIVLIILSVGISSLSLYLGKIPLDILLIILVSLFANLFFRQNVLVANLEEKSLKYFVVLNIGVLVSVVSLNGLNFELKYIQLFISLLIIFSLLLRKKIDASAW